MQRSPPRFRRRASGLWIPLDKRLLLGVPRVCLMGAASAGGGGTSSAGAGTAAGVGAASGVGLGAVPDVEFLSAVRVAQTDGTNNVTTLSGSYTPHANADFVLGIMMGRNSTTSRQWVGDVPERRRHGRGAVHR